MRRLSRKKEKEAGRRPAAWLATCLPAWACLPACLGLLPLAAGCPPGRLPGAPPPLPRPPCSRWPAAAA
eukprot:13425208-Heterocapsa_arctica.AAC.1